MEGRKEGLNWQVGGEEGEEERERTAEKEDGGSKEEVVDCSQTFPRFLPVYARETRQS
jgi:hypothetical protein